MTGLKDKDTNPNQPIPVDSKNIGSIHDSADICAIQKILTLTVHFVHTPPPVPASTIFCMGERVTPRHHPTTHQQKEWHIKEILYNATTHPICYRTYQLNRIHIQVRHILLSQFHLNHQKVIIVNKDNVQKRIKLSSVVRRVSTTLPKIAQILQPSYLQPRKNQKSQSSNLMKIYYSTSFISHPSWIKLKLFNKNL